MSGKISRIGKIWLLFLLLIAILGIVTNFMTVSKGYLYAISGIACIGEAIALFYLLKGRGIKFFWLYCACYIVNVVVSLDTTKDINTSFIIGFVIGILINIELTFLAAKRTFKKEEEIKKH
ncbi:MAG: hypothetical protein IJL76_00340 [Bacilli bacterium]|nr:hypothetical protein [Bacilli bacterium]